MWTNVFRIGEFQVVSWFQFLPYESDSNPIPEKSIEAEQKDAASSLVLSAHLQLQNNGFFSTWTNSFVGPWDPSQGVHNPDEKIKLWLFIPGRHSSINETAQLAVSKLRVVGTGHWLAPGDSEEVAVALSQALRNSLERALRGLSYVRYGDVFTRCHSFFSNTQDFRRTQPMIEFIFSVTEEAIYVHAIISAKHIRGLCGDDMERLSKHRSSDSIGEGLPVIVAPCGMRGRLTGCCPSDLVNQVHISQLKASKGVTPGMPFVVARSSGCQLRGQSCYVEVTLGFSSKCSDKTFESIGNQNKNAVYHHTEEAQLASAGRKQGLQCVVLQNTFIYQPETVLVPLMHKAFARTSLKRFSRKNWAGTSLSELWPLWSSGSSQIEHCLAFGSACNGESLDGLGVNKIQLQHHYNSSSNSSSISSVSSTSTETDHVMAIGGGDLEADADSRSSKRSNFSSNDQIENEGYRMEKRARTDAFDHTGQVIAQDAYKSSYGTAEASDSASVGLTNFGSQWDWDDGDDEKGFGLDIQAILLEFGDFSDFFENDVLSFGEPPGTAESPAIMVPAADCGDVIASPSTGGMYFDQKFSPGALPSLEGVSLPFGTILEDTQSESTESRDARPSVAGNNSLPPPKAEAIMTLAPEYAAVETPNEFSNSIFKSPYLPRSKKVESLQSSSSAYIYSVTPCFPCVDMSEEKPDTSSKVKMSSAGHDTNSCTQALKLYSHVQSGTKRKDIKSFSEDTPSCKEEPSCLSGINASSTFTFRKKNEQTFEAGRLLLPLKTVPATEIECIMFQAAMCRIRHTLLSLCNPGPFGFGKLSGNADLISCITSTTSDMLCSKYELKKKDSIPARIAGEADGGFLDEPLTTRVGVWRSVGVPKGTKPLNMRISENSLSLANNISNDDGLNFCGQRQPLQELLDSMTLLVQQSTSFVDVSLDMDGSESSYCWLALQEQRRRGFSCGPSMVHAGCGGLLATCHSVDIAGVDLIDPLSADVQPSFVISLLQSDIKVALKSAFGCLDGPLSVIDWCKGRTQSVDSGATGEGYSYSNSEAKDSSTSISMSGEPISPQSIGGSSIIREGPRTDDSYQRRLNQDMGNSESEQQKCYYRVKPTVAALPLPSILVGYQDDWLKTSASSLQFWEKAPFEPYALQKPVTYYAVCPDIHLLASAADDFFQQLGTAVLQTLIESSAALGSTVPSPDRARQSWLYSQVAKAQTFTTAAADEPSPSNIPTLSGFTIPKLVLQIVTVDRLLSLNRPTNELALLKDIAFTVYNKARRVPQTFQSPVVSGRPPASSIWKALSREGCSVSRRPTIRV